MKKVSRQKLAVAAEMIRSLTPAHLGTVAGGVVVVVVTTTHSIITICSPVTISGSTGTAPGTIAQ